MIEHDGRDIREHDGKRYQFIRGSDVLNDGMYLEVCDEEEPGDVILFAFWSDANDDFTFTAYREKLPFSLVELFVQEARASLPPCNGDLKDGD